MKLLLDENLSRRLVVRLAELYPGSAHVAEADLLESQDREIWEFAKAGSFIIVTTDSDFYELATTIGPPHRTTPQGGLAPALDTPDAGRGAGTASRRHPDH